MCMLVSLLHIFRASCTILQSIRTSFRIDLVSWVSIKTAGTGDTEMTQCPQIDYSNENVSTVVIA